MALTGAAFMVVFGLLTFGRVAILLFEAPFAPAILTIGVLVLAFTGYYAYAGGRDVVAATRRLQQLPYVPTARRQLAELPSEELLLRGSASPSAPPDELLRAGFVSPDTPDGELLRAGQSKAL